MNSSLLHPYFFSSSLTYLQPPHPLTISIPKIYDNLDKKIVINVINILKKKRIKGLNIQT